MSHFAEIELKMQGSAEVVARALCEMEGRYGKFQRSQIEVHAERQNLHGYNGDVREQKAHVIIRRQNVGSASNDIGFEQRADGKWVAHISDYDKGKYNADWQSRLLSKWAIQKIGLEAENQGYKWAVRNGVENNVKYQYVTVSR